MAANCIFLVVCFQKWRGLGEQRTGKKCGIQCPKVINNFLSLKKKETAGGIEGDFLASGEFSFFREHTELPIVEEVEASLWYILKKGVNKSESHTLTYSGFQFSSNLPQVVDARFWEFECLFLTTSARGTFM